MLEQVNERLGAIPRSRFFVCFLQRMAKGADQSDMTSNFLIEAEKPTGFLAITEEWLREAAEQLGVVVEAIKAGEFGHIKEAQTAVRDLKAAVQLAIFEGERVEKLRKTVAGGVGTGQLDLHAARDEIGRRLACLRNASPG